MLSLDFLVGSHVFIDWMSTERGVKRISDAYEVGKVVGRTHLRLWNMKQKEEIIPFAGFYRGIVRIKYLGGRVIFQNPHAEKAYANGSIGSQEKDELFEKGEWKV